jgi:Tfp pilus assembly protein FimT
MADDLERERLVALTEIAAAEASLFRALWDRFKEWAVRLRSAVFGSSAPSGRTSEGLLSRPDPDGVWSTSKWWDQQLDDLTPVIEEIWTDSYAGTPEAPPWHPDAMAGPREAARRARNRLVNVPESVYADIRHATATAVADGQHPGELAAKIEQILGENDIATWRNRAITIARTEALAAHNGGRFASYTALAKSSGGSWEKIWLATHDHRTRYTHTKPGGGDLQRVPLLEPFTIGGAPMMYPGDPEGPADETINCRCTILLVEPGEHVDMSDRHMRSAR